VILAEDLSVLSSIKVPPLKSTPKFNPLKTKKTKEAIINIPESILKLL
jgi:hypothetical protein